MKEANRKPALWRRCGRAVFRSRSVCPHCGARTGHGGMYFIVAYILLGLGAGMVGQYIVSLQWESVIIELEHEIMQPFPLHGSEEVTPEPAAPQDGEPTSTQPQTRERADSGESPPPG